MKKNDPQNSEAEKICRDSDFNAIDCAFADFNVTKAMLKKLVLETISPVKNRMTLNTPTSAYTELNRNISSTNNTKYVIGGDVCVDPPNATKKMKRG